MRTKSIPVIIAAGTFVVGAAAIAARVIEKSNFKGKFAFTVCSDSETITCEDGTSGSLSTDVFLDGTEFSSKSQQFPDLAQNTVTVTLQQFNSCTGQFSGGFGTVEDAFSAQGLESADLEGSVPLTAFEGGSFGTLDVDVTLEGFGNIRNDRSKFRFEFEGDEGPVVVSGRFNGKSRSATSSGTLTLDGSEVSCVFQDGTLTDSKSGFREVQH
jgi:hypothetical protein